MAIQTVAEVFFYVDSIHSLPKISDAAVKKLRQLTVAHLASTRKNLPYKDLLNALQLPDVRSLEDLLIDAIYSYIIVGKLDQKNQSLEIEYAVGRDLPPSGSLDEIINTLMQWSSTCENMLTALDNNTQLANTAKANDLERRAKLEAEIRNIHKSIQKDRDVDMMGGGSGSGKAGGGCGGEFSSMEYFNESSVLDHQSDGRRGASSSRR